MKIDFGAKKTFGSRLRVRFHGPLPLALAHKIFTIGVNIKIWIWLKETVERIYIRRKRRRWAYSFFHLSRFRPWDPTKTPRFLEEEPHFFSMRSEDCETAHLLGCGPVLLHNNACVRDVLTAPSNVYLNLGLNLFHSYF